MTGRVGRRCLISPSNSSPSIPGMLMSERTAMSVGWISPLILADLPTLSAGLVVA